MTPSPSGRILCFGEMLLRLNPPEGEVLMQGQTLTVRPGGAEANVAVSLARYGAPTAMATVLPDNALGHGTRDEVRRHGVDTSGVEFRPGRMGLYFMTPGAVRRPADVLYDRADSAFVKHVDTAFDWPRLLDGVEWLHVSGVTPAVGPTGTRAALQAVEAAKAAGVKVSFDGQFPRQAVGANGRATRRRRSARCCPRPPSPSPTNAISPWCWAGPSTVPIRMSAAGRAAAAAFEAFPTLERIACTLRVQESVADQALSAIMLTRDGPGFEEVHAAPIHMAGGRRPGRGRRRLRVRRAVRGLERLAG